MGESLEKKDITIKEGSSLNFHNCSRHEKMGGI